MSVISTMLLIQADPALRAGLSFGFEREGIEVITAPLGDAAEIESAVAKARPQLVIAGAASEKEGVETLASVKSALSEAKLSAPVLYVGNGVNRDQALSEGATDVLDGPGFVRDVVTLAKLLASRKSAESDRLAGQLSDHFGLFYLLRAVSRARKRCVLTLVRGLRRGELRFYDGEVTSAAVGVLHGLAALHQLLLWTDASFELRPEEVVARRQIPLRPDEVIADAERFLVEVKEVAGGISPSFVYEHHPDPDPEVLESVPRQIGSVFRLFDGSRKVADVIEDSPYRMFETLRVANRLAEAGLIRRVETPIRRQRAYTALSIEEWLTGTEATVTEPITDASEPIGPPVGEPASPPRTKKRNKKNKKKKGKKSREIKAAVTTAEKPAGKKRVEWKDVMPKRAPTEPGGVTTVVPSTAASGEFAADAAEPELEKERPSVLVSAAATEEPTTPPEREGALEKDPETVGKLFRDDGSEAAEAAADEATELAKRGARQAAGEITSPVKTVKVNFDGGDKAASEPSILIDEPAIDEAAAAKAKAEKEAAAEKKAAAEAKAKAEKEAAEEKAAAEAKAKAEKEAAEEKAKAEKKAAEEKAKAEKKAAEEKAKAEKKAAEEKAKAEKEAARKAKKKAKKAKKRATKVEEAEPQPEADASLPDLAATSASDVAKVAADAAAAADDIAAFSDAEEAFFRAGRKLADAPAPPIDSFDDLDEGYDLPKTFWQRLMRRPGDTGRKPSDDD